MTNHADGSARVRVLALCSIQTSVASIQFALRHLVNLLPLSLWTFFPSRRHFYLRISHLSLVSPFSPLSLFPLLITNLSPVSVAAMTDGPSQPARPPFLSRLPRWLSRWLGYRDAPPSAPPPVYVLYLWPFIGAFCGLSLLQAVFGHARYFINRGVPSIIASYVSVSPPYSRLSASNLT
jgi:hypothetical protein